MTPAGRTKCFFVLKKRIGAACLLLGLSFLCAPVSPVVAGEKHGRHEKLREWLGLLSEQDRAKYKAAKKQAMLNAEVQAANERRRKVDAEYRHLLHAEMLRIDPSVRPLLDKVEELERRDDL